MRPILGRSVPEPVAELLVGVAAGIPADDRRPGEPAAALDVDVEPRRRVEDRAAEALQRTGVEEPVLTPVRVVAVRHVELRTGDTARGQAQLALDVDDVRADHIPALVGAAGHAVLN